MIASKYISDPLCIDEHKCDVRLYVVVTSFDPLVIYLYEEGLVRLATVKYDKAAENLWNPCMHLCNYSINKYHADYIKATEVDEDIGHKWTFSALLRHLRQQGNDTTSLMQAIEDVIIKSIFACTQSISSACRMFVPNHGNCFELYGFDILIDNTLRPWLLEVNLSPSLGIDTPLDTKVKSHMLTDLLNLIGMPAQSPVAKSDEKGLRFKSPANSNPATGRRPCVEIKPVTGMNASKHLKLGLSGEENRILKNVRAQHTRRRGFVRIFPTEDSMQRYGQFLDSQTGVPSTIISGIYMPPVIASHNYNMMLHTHLFSGTTVFGDNSIEDRMKYYERALATTSVDQIFRNLPERSQHQALYWRKQMQKTMENGSELTLLQARKLFLAFMECVLRRLTQEARNPNGTEKSQHEKLILKFITRSDLTIKPPSFMRHPASTKVPNKDRTAIIAKLLGEYLEAFDRDTEFCVDNYSYFSLIPNQMYEKFKYQATEADLEFILTLHVNLTRNLSFLYNRYTSNTNIPAVPPIPTGANGFLRALPNMAPNIPTRDLAQIDSYYRSLCPISSERDVMFESMDKGNRPANMSMVKKRTSVA